MIHDDSLDHKLRTSKNHRTFLNDEAERLCYLGSEVMLFGQLNVSTLFGFYGSQLVLPLSRQHRLFQL